MSRKIDTASLAGGMILIVLGTLFLLDRLRVAGFGDILRYYWPMIIVLVGLPKLFQYRTMWAGLWLITVGAWLQIARLKLFGLTYRSSWPLLLIALGAGIILRAFIDSLPRRDEEEQREA